MRNQLKFDDAIPLHVFLDFFFLADRAIFQNNGLFHPCEDKVAKFFMSTVESPYVPTNADVDQSNWDNLALGTTAFN